MDMSMASWVWCATSKWSAICTSARRARAVGGHWFFRARMRIQYTPPKRAREDASSIEDADAAKRAELRGGGLQ